MKYPFLDKFALQKHAQMSNSSSYVSDSLKAAPFQLNIWFGSFLWVTGNIGCLGNIIVFRSRSFRERAYSIYLVSEALSDCLYFNFVLLTRILQKGFQIPLTTRYDSVCKLRQFSSVWGNQVSFSLFMFATIDRILSAQRDNSKTDFVHQQISFYFSLKSTVDGVIAFLSHTKQQSCVYSFGLF